MSRKHGFDKLLKPYGFWDHFITGNILGVAMLGLHWMNFSNGIVDSFYFAGMLIGLLAGQLSIYLTETFRQGSNRMRLAYLGVSVLPLFVSIVLFRSARLAVGYFFGLGLTLGFGSALVALIKRNLNQVRETDK